MSKGIAEISSEAIDLISRRVGSKIREIKLEDGQKYWCLITLHSAIVYAELSRKVIFVYPEELQHTGLLQKDDGSVTLYGIQSGCRVVTFDVTSSIKGASSKCEHKRRTEDGKEVQNDSPKRFKKEDKEKESSNNEAIFHSLLTSDLTGMNNEKATIDNVGEAEDFGKQTHEDIVYIEGATVVHEDAQIVDCLILGNILVTMATCLEGYILSFHTIPFSNNVTDDQSSTASSPHMNVFASFFIKELRPNGPFNSASKAHHSSQYFAMSESLWTRTAICGLKLSAATKSSASFGVDYINNDIFADIFGYECTSLGSEVVVMGTPDGKILGVPLKCGGQKRTSISVLFDLEEAAVCLSSMSLTNHDSQNTNINIQDCLLFVGKRGKIVVMYCEQEHGGSKVSKMKTVTEEKLVTGPVLSPIKVNSDCLVYSTKKELFCIRMALVDSPSNKSKSKLLTLTTRQYPVTGVVAISKLPDISTSEDNDQRFVACLENGRVLSLRIKDNDDSEEAVSMTTRQAGQRMKELMISLQEVAKKSEEVRNTSQIQNSILSEMTKAGHLAGMLLGEQPGANSKPFLTEMRTFLQYNGSEKHWMIECKITNKSDWTFDERWTVCAHIFSKNKTREVLNTGSLSNPVTSVTYPLNNWNPGTFNVLGFPLDDDGRTFLAPPIEIKLYLHLKPFASTHYQTNLRCEQKLFGGQLSPGNNTGLVLPIGLERVDVTNFLELYTPTNHDGLTVPQSSSKYGNVQNQSTHVAMETMHKTTGDWLSHTLKEMISTRMPTVHEERDTTKGMTKLALKCPGIVLTQETMAVLHLQGGNFFRWMFESNAPVNLLLQENPSLNSLQLQSPSGVHAQILQSRDDGASNEVKVQIHTSSHHLLVEIMEAIHFKLSQCLGQDHGRACSTGSGEDKARFISSIQNIEKRLAQLTEKDINNIPHQELEDVYGEMRNLNIRF